MMSFAWPDAIDRIAALISRHEDAGAQAAALEYLGVTPVRGSGGPADRAYYKGGAPAMRQLMRQLESGASVAMTADVPKRARVCGLGIVTLAKLSGRPIVPTAVVTSRRIQFNSWDRASLGLPFSRAVVVAGDLVRVPPTPTTRRWRRRASPCSRASTRRTNAPTRWSARPIPARI